MLTCMKTITIANLKGGSAKTTTTAYLAHAFAAMGKAVLAVDADPQASLLRWSEAEGWAIPTTGLPVKGIHNRIAGIVSPATDVVCIDTPPLDEQAGIVYGALRVADVIVVTMAPTTAEFERLPDVWAAIEEVDALRMTPPTTAVLLNRTVQGAASTATFRQQIVQDGHYVLTTTIPRRESYAQAFGAAITELGLYEKAAAEIDALEVAL
jgi:chromosome partitioning protein